MTMLDQPLRPNEIAADEASRIDMEAFDRLPASYRDLIRDAPIEIPPTAARAYLAAFGRHLGLRFLKWAVEARLRTIRRSAGDGQGGDRSTAARSGGSQPGPRSDARAGQRQ